VFFFFLFGRAYVGVVGWWQRWWRVFRNASQPVFLKKLIFFYNSKGSVTVMRMNIYRWFFAPTNSHLKFIIPFYICINTLFYRQNKIFLFPPNYFVSKQQKKITLVPHFSFYAFLVPLSIYILWVLIFLYFDIFKKGNLNAKSIRKINNVFEMSVLIDEHFKNKIWNSFKKT
jgi:hypothetical protein